MKMTVRIFTLSIFCLVPAVFSQAQTSESRKTSENQTQKQAPEKDKPLQIKSKPRVEPGNCRQSSGIVSLRVTFDKSAKVTEIEIASSSGCGSFDNKAVSAAKRIKFNPAIKDGEPITVKKQVQYSFTKY